MDIITELYQHVQGRSRPEDVAECVLRALGSTLDQRTQTLLERAARGSLARGAMAYSSMSTQFFRAIVQAKPQIELTAVLMSAPPLFGSLEPLSDADCRRADAVRAFVTRASSLIHRAYGDRRRMSKRDRFAMGLFKEHRWYGKRFRLLVRLEDKIDRMVRADRRFDVVRSSKSSLATKLSLETFSRDTASACLIAYVTARMNLRSVFTNGPQARAYDEIAEALLAHAQRATPCWFAIAHAMPDKHIVKNLTEEERGKLLAMAFEVLRDASSFLREVWGKSHIDKATMIVRRGNDSSTWNEAAGAWNKARDSWIALLYALGMDGLLDSMLPGKVMRLMAADVAHWHLATGGRIHPDTAVFAELPLPWEVLDGTVACSRRLVTATCDKHDASIEGWIGPRGARVATLFTPTPELVHGVAVSSPALAFTLRKLGVFSGKALTGPLPAEVSIERDEHGAALHAHEKG
ncbi:MAG: hypothetical protein HOW73_51170 [Polyangiaceae bacterium]|nr:hypothetical protein [Polyangiaceae bacterium]